MPQKKQGYLLLIFPHFFPAHGGGFVASLTEAAGYTFFTMSEESKEKFLEDPG